MHGGMRNTKFELENFKGRDHLGEAERKMLLRWILKTHNVNWIQRAQDRVK
jgi:hypothetical protein